MYIALLRVNHITLFLLPTTPSTVTLAGSIFLQPSGQMYSASDYSCIRDAQECVLIDQGQSGTPLKNLNVLPFCIT